VERHPSQYPERSSPDPDAPLSSPFNPFRHRDSPKPLDPRLSDAPSPFVPLRLAYTLSPTDHSLPSHFSRQHDDEIFSDDPPHADDAPVPARRVPLDDIVQASLTITKFADFSELIKNEIHRVPFTNDEFPSITTLLQTNISDTKKRKKIRDILYRRSEKGKDATKRYEKSEKGKDTIKKYETSNKRKDTRKIYETSKKGKDTRKRYGTSDKGKDAIKKYETSNKGKDRKKRYKDKNLEDITEITKRGMVTVFEGNDTLTLEDRETREQELQMEWNILNRPGELQ
jgi:hypothetical protein